MKGGSKSIEINAWIESMKGINIHQGYSIAAYFYHEAIQFHLIIVFFLFCIRFV